MISPANLIKSIACLLVLLLILTITGCFYSQEKVQEIGFPEKPIDLIIVWSAGGGSDLATRLIGSYAAQELGVPFNYLNVTGANGDHGWTQTAKAAADGYTVTNLTFDILTNQAMGQSAVKYTDFDLLCQFTVQPIGVFVSAASPYQTLEDLLKAAAERPNEITMATTPLGGFFHQGATLLENASQNARFDVIPYKGSAEIIAALVSGKAEAGIQTLTGMEPYMEENGLRLLAVLTEDRLDNFPEIPTAKELGYDVVYKSWRGFAVPKGTPEPIKETLIQAFEKAFNNPEFQKKAEAAKLDLVYAGPEAFKEALDQQYPHVEMILKQLGFVK